MLVIHWSPVKNTKHILKDGITKNKNGVYCFPLTGNRYVDKFWVDVFNSKNKKKFNGFIFRLEESDMPAYFGDWFGATNDDRFEKKINSQSHSNRGLGITQHETPVSCAAGPQQNVETAAASHQKGGKEGAPKGAGDEVGDAANVCGCASVQRVRCDLSSRSVV